MPVPDGLPDVEFPIEATAGQIPVPRDLLAQPSPARAEPHDETSWLPLPELEELPTIHELLEPSPDAEPVVPRDISVAPSPARAEPHDATSWLPLPDSDLLPEITELVAPDRAPPEEPQTVTAPRRRHPIRWAVLGALAVTTIVGGLFSFDSLFDNPDVDLQVDGRLITAETGVSTVGSLLKEHNVNLGRDDRVAPPADAEITNGMTIHVYRAFPVSVDLDGQITTEYTTFSDPARFIRSLDFGPKVVMRDPPKRLTSGAPIVMRTEKVGTLLLDGTAINYESPSLTVRELLESYSVVLGPQDYTGPLAVDDALPDLSSVVVVRVALLTESQEEPYEVPDREVKDPDMEVGETRVKAGKPGVQRVTYQVTQRDGNSIDRTPISKVPLQEAKPKIVYIGTKADPRWDKMAQCETGGNWSAPGPTWQGGLGIWYGNWESFGGKDFAPTAGEATREQQIVVAERIRKEHGWHAWGCAKTIGIK